MVEDDRGVGKGIGQLGDLADLRMVEPGVEGEVALGELLEALAPGLVARQLGRRIGARVADAGIGVPAGLVADALEAAVAGGDLGVEHRARLRAQAQVDVADDAGAGAQVAVDARRRSSPPRRWRTRSRRCSAARPGLPCGTSNGSRRRRCRRCCGRSGCRPAGRGTCSRCRRAARDDGADRRSAARARAPARSPWRPSRDRARSHCRAFGVVSAAIVSSICIYRTGCSAIIETWAAIDLPADIGKAHPGLGLPAGHLAAAHLVDQRHGGDVAPQRHDVEAQPLLLGARARADGPREGRGCGRSRSRARCWRGGWCAGCSRRWRRAPRRSCRSAPARSARTARAPRRRLRECSVSDPSRRSFEGARHGHQAGVAAPRRR